MDCPQGPVGTEEVMTDCYGKGRCVTMETMARKRRNALGDPDPFVYSYHMQTNKSASQLWDSKMIQGCMCDIYWYEDGLWTQNKSDPTGFDCGKLTCPSGDNPQSPKVSPKDECKERQALNPISLANLVSLAKPPPPLTPPTHTNLSST
jgi:hypothetical protein